MSAIEPSLEDISDYLWRRQLIHMTTFATATFLVYDILLTLQEEYNYVWKSRWSLPKMIFLLNRYYAPALFVYVLTCYFITPPTHNVLASEPGYAIKLMPGHHASCRMLGYLAAPTSMPAMILVSAILIVRTWAILDRKRWILIALCAGYAVSFGSAFLYYFIVTRDRLTPSEVATLAKVTAFHATLIKKGPSEASDEFWMFHTCFSVGVPKPLGMTMATSLVYESILMGIMLRRRYVTGPLSKPVERFYADGVIYYVLMFFCLVGATFGCYYSETSRAFVASRYFIGMKSMLCSRLILRLRWSFDQDTTSFRSTDLSDPTHFATGTRIFFATPETFEMAETPDVSEGGWREAEP